MNGLIGSANEMLLERLMTDQVAPMQALGLIAAHHVGQPAGLLPFRLHSVGAGVQEFPMPDDVPVLVSQLVVATRRLFEEAADPIDDLHVAGFLLWGLTAIHPFENGNGRTACDFVQYTLMSRWRSATPPFKELRGLPATLEPVFRHLEPTNDGSPEGHLRQLQSLLATFEAATVEKLKKNEHFETLAKVLAASLKTN